MRKERRKDAHEHAPTTTHDDDDDHASLVNSKKLKIGSGIGNFPEINSQELRIGNFFGNSRREGEGHRRAHR